jgi:hypothetical protein
MTLASVLAWLSANWQPIVVALLAIDAAIIPLFPNAGILKTIQNALTTVEKV